jgi:type II secretory pathway component PulM
MTEPVGGGSAFQRLSSREQTMVVGLAVVLVLVLVLGLGLLVQARLKKATLRLSERRDQLSMVEALEGQYRAAEAEQNQQRQTLQRNNVQLFSLLNKTATELGLKLDNLNERTTPIKDTGVAEVSVDVSLKDISITKLHKFMEKLENPSAGVVKVTKLKVKTSFANEENLDISMTVSTYRITSGGDSKGGTP